MKKNILLCLVLCAFSLYIGEIVVRALDLGPQAITDIGRTRFVDNPKIVYEFVPGAIVDGSVINAQGFKGAEFVKEKPPGCIRIAMLGDSITQGLFIKAEDTFSSQLEKMLNQNTAGKNKLRYEVMNFGVGGYNLEAEVETLKTKVLQYSPDIVVLNFFRNDDEPIPGLYVFFLEEDGYTAEQRAAFIKKYIFNHRNPLVNYSRKLLNKSKLYLFIMDRFDSLNKNRFVSRMNQQREWLGAGFLDNLSEIKSLKEKYGFKFLICIHQSLSNSEHPNDKKIEEIARSFGFPCFYMLPYYKERFSSLDRIESRTNDHVHVNELGQRIAAQAFMKELNRHGFIKAKTRN